VAANNATLLYYANKAQKRRGGSIGGHLRSATAAASGAYIISVVAVWP